MSKKVKVLSNTPSPDITGHKRVEEAPGKALDELEMRVEERTAQLAKANEELRIEIVVRKLAKEALQESEEKYKTIFESVSDIIIHLNKYGKIVDVNKRIEDYFGYTREEVIGKHLTKLGVFSLKDLPKMAKLFSEAVRGKILHSIEVEVKRKDGSTALLEAKTTLIKKDGKIEGTVAIIHDITERKRAEEALRESEEFSSSLLTNSPNPILVTNPDTSVRYVNPALEKLTGFTSAEIIGRKAPYPWWTEETLQKTSRDFEEALDKGIEKIEELFRKKNGERFWVEITAAPVRRDGEFKYYLANWVDITKRKEAEESLADEATRRRILIEQSRDGIVILDQSGKVYESNQRFAEMLRFSPEEVSQLHVWDWEFQFAREQLLDMIRGIDETGDQFETQHRRKDGSIYNVEISTNGAVFAGQKLIFCVCRDITERKQAEEALQESEERYRALVNLGAEVGEAITMAQDTEQGEAIHVFVNDEWPRITGYSREELLGMSFLDLVHPKHREASIERHRRKMSGKTTPGPFEMTIIRKDGTEVPIEFTGAYTMYKGKHADVVYIRDITERKRAEEELRSFNKLAVGRELRMIELKKEINAILQKLGGKPRYKIAEENKTKLNK